MAEALMKYETIDVEQIDDIMNGQRPREPKGWSDDEQRTLPKAPLTDGRSRTRTIGGTAPSH